MKPSRILKNFWTLKMKNRDYT